MSRRIHTPSAPRGRQGGQALVLIFLGALLAGGAASGLGSARQLHEMKKRIDVTVTDDTQRQAAEKAFKAFETELKAAAKAHGHMERVVFAALARHDTTDAQLDALLAQADAQAAATRAAVLQHRFALREQFTPEQWRALFAAPAASAVR